MRKSKILYFPLLTLMVMGFFWAGVSIQADVVYLLNMPEKAEIHHGNIQLNVLFMNNGSMVEQCEIPNKMYVLVSQKNTIQKKVLATSLEREKIKVDLNPREFKSVNYVIPVPEEVSEEITIALECTPPVTIKIEEGLSDERSHEEFSKKELEQEIETDLDRVETIREESEKNIFENQDENDKWHSAMIEYFNSHFSPYDPMYFLIGANPSGGDADLTGDFPNARFQISMRYKPFIPDTFMADKWSGITNIYFAYTQNSIWDLRGDSAPFIDTTYRPEFQYLWTDVFNNSENFLSKLDLLFSLAHESNGKAGLDSRSINYFMIRPMFYWGNHNGLNGYLAPGFWVYLGSLSDNPRIRHYRGHADVKAAIQWADGIQLAGYFRIGDELEKGSMQLDLSYPLGYLTRDFLDFFFHIQYFTGYGQSMLHYDCREQALRAGISLFR